LWYSALSFERIESDGVKSHGADLHPACGEGNNRNGLCCRQNLSQAPSTSNCLLRTPCILKCSLANPSAFVAYWGDCSSRGTHPMARERRKNFRVEWNSSASIYDCDGNWGHSCVVKDLSNGGAKITAVPVSDVPDQFMLRIARGSRGTRKCHVLWRSPDALGVEFTDRFAGAEPNTKRATHAL
jgi:hypothetical protein